MGNPKHHIGKIVFESDDFTTPAFIDEWNGDTPYIVAHTSGSTGKPKEIRLSKNDMRRSAEATCAFFGINASSVMLSPLSCDYIAGKMMVVRALVSDARLVVETPSNMPMKEFDDAVDLLPVVPSQLRYLSEHLDRLSRVRNLLIGGAAISADMERRLIDLGVNAFVSYGMTETCSHVALRKVGQRLYTALAGISFATDSDSCLRVISERFSFGELVTNDIVRLVDNGSFEWLGRRDNVINSGGVKVLAETIEAKISAVADKRLRFYVTSRPDEKWGETPVVVAERSGDASMSSDLFRGNLLPAERPRQIVIVERLPLTATGKIRRLRPDALDNIIESIDL